MCTLLVKYFSAQYFWTTAILYVIVGFIVSGIITYKLVMVQNELCGSKDFSWYSHLYLHTTSNHC